jgi:TonB family protein
VRDLGGAKLLPDVRRAIAASRPASKSGGGEVTAALVRVLGVVAASTAIVSAGDEMLRKWQGALDLRRAVTIKSERVSVDARELEAAGVAPEEFTPPRRVKGGAPTYPESAARAGAQGLVRLECLIRSSGGVEACRTIQSVYPAIDRAAAEAIGHWKYEPARVKSEPKSIVAQFVVIFSLQ